MTRRRRGATAWFDEEAETRAAPDPFDTCGLCRRPIPAAARSSLHHLTPKLKGGAKLGTVRLHQICHSAIHARFSEAELARRLADLEALRAEPEIPAFLRWIESKPPDFHAPTRMTGRLRERRARR